jgi:hypothetical protein
MQTVSATLTENEWTVIASGHVAVMFDVLSAGTALVHITPTNDAPPDLDAPAHEVASWPSTFHFFLSGLSGTMTVHARAKSGTIPIVVTR